MPLPETTLISQPEVEQLEKMHNLEEEHNNKLDEQDEESDEDLV